MTTASPPPPSSPDTISAASLNIVRAGLQASGIQDVNDRLVQSVAARLGETRIKDSVTAGLTGFFCRREFDALAAQVAEKPAAPTTREEKIQARLKATPGFATLRGQALLAMYHRVEAEVAREGALTGSAKVIAEASVRGTSDPLLRLRFANALATESEGGNKPRVGMVPLKPADVAALNTEGLTATQRLERVNTLSHADYHRAVRRLAEMRGRAAAYHAKPALATAREKEVLAEAIRNAERALLVRWGKRV